MIEKISVHGFKRFHDAQFKIGGLTVLAGVNGAGKTSLIHAFLLAWEATAGRSRHVVRLNDPFGIELGTAEDMLNWKSNDFIEFSIQSEEKESVWRFSVETEEALYLTVEKTPELPPSAFSGRPRTFAYLSAERLGPRSTLGVSPLPPDELEVGVQGEYCAQILSTFGKKLIEDSARMHPKSEEESPSLLKYEVERWLGEIARPVEIETITYPDSAVTGMRFRTPGGDWVRAPNMGFGISYALPIILAGLTAKVGGLLIVENPEAHLHPAGQSRMGVFLAWLAGRGVQVIIETHSDHILNGIRRAIGEHEYLKNDQATVHFFDADEQGEPVVYPLEFTPTGGVSDWPPGFFDQYRIDVASLGRVRRGS